MNHISTLEKANIDNLTRLWQAASRPFNGFCETESYNYCFIPGSGWPNKLWFKEALTLKRLNLAKEEILLKAPSLNIPYWGKSQDEIALFKKCGFVISSEQVAMYKHLSALLPFESKLDIKRIRKEGDIVKWSDIYPKAFGYVIHKNTLSETVENIHFYLASYNNRPVGTAMLFYTDNIVGIHGVGIVPQARRKGFAEQMMVFLLNEAMRNNAKTAVLQASSMGKNLYTHLGFEEQFIIKNYKTT